MAFGAFNFELNTFIIVCAFLALLTPIMDKVIICAGWTVISWSGLEAKRTGAKMSNIEKGINSTKKNEDTEKVVITESIRKSKWSVTYLIKIIRYLGISIFMHHMASYLILILVLIQIVINRLLSFNFDFRPWLIIYAGIIGPIFVTLKVWQIVKQEKLENGYDSLFGESDANGGCEYFF